MFCDIASGAAIVLDPVLHGINFTDMDHFEEEGHLHDEDYWPQHFLAVREMKSKFA